jgi:rubrerythrin
VQLSTLELLVNEINKNYDVDLGSLKTVFTGIINDEEHHRELLGKARELIENRREKPVSAPFVKYQNPDAWIRPTE